MAHDLETELAQRASQLEKELELKLQAKWQNQAKELVETETKQATAKLTAALRLAESERQAEAEAQAELLAKSKAKIAAMQQREAELLEQENEQRLNLARQKAAIVAEAKAQAAEASRLELQEKDKLLADLRREVAEATAKANRGSQQLQGEILELDIESSLRQALPNDRIEPVGKGINGADIILVINDRQGRGVAKIVIETKRVTQTGFKADFLTKLREDNRRAQGNIALLITPQLPGEIKNFGYRDGVYLANPESALTLIQILRQQLLALAETKDLALNKQDRMSQIYDYLISPSFRHKIESLAETYLEMQTNLHKEKGAMQRLWASREQQISSLIGQTAGLYGDVAGIIGQAMPQVNALELIAPADLLSSEPVSAPALEDN
ncbi:MAG: hypothetical protein CEO22_348 [Candidatus Berkelbacteria bacterium Gr01-1014_85]|uniref:DUF2130 domain-containing protein n=1 Tax=Candidatus Berkelbacteria bacterium Gr01-1014_85 TaxID=2017150 RepID=A0A554JBP8_9BACT|nr:MAG: hypothetical protein CEO22_348 [Candidatus Berkelbacteria bacterium Gr01-1014_85]